jgi:hypothetical protein
MWKEDLGHKSGTMGQVPGSHLKYYREDHLTCQDFDSSISFSIDLVKSNLESSSQCFHDSREFRIATQSDQHTFKIDQLESPA